MKKKLTVTMTPEVSDRFDKLKLAMGTADGGEAVRAALQVLEHVLEREAAGDKFFVVRQDGTTAPVRFLEPKGGAK